MSERGPVLRRVAAGLLLSALARGAAIDTDWPQWRGPTRDGISAESSGWPTGWPPKKRWTASVGYGCTSPIIAGGKLYVMGWTGSRNYRANPVGTDTVHCLDARTGRVLWKQAYPCHYHCRQRAGDLGQYGGPSSTPTLDRETGWLYTLSVDGHLHCWDTKREGKLVWKMNLYDAFKPPLRPDVGRGRREYGYPTAPLILGGLLLIEVGARDGTVMAFDKTTGQRRWASQYTGHAGHTGGLCPMAVEGVPCLAVLALRNLVVMRLDNGHEGHTVATTPWVTDTACNIPSPAVAGQRVLVTSGYNHSHASLFEITRKGARKLWTTERAHAVTSTPVIYRGRAYMVHISLQCVDLATGKLRWRGGSFGNGTCLVTAGDDKVIVFGRRTLALAEARPERDEYRELCRVDRVVRGTCYPQVTLSNGVLVCKDRNGAMVVYSVRPVPDTAPPTLVAAVAAGDPTKLRVRFSEPVDPATAQDTAHYALDYGVRIVAATLDDDGASVTLSLAPRLHEGGTYTLTVHGVADRAKPPHRIARDSQATFRFTPTRRVVDGLVALYRFAEGKGTTVRDASGAGEPLNLVIADPEAARWVDGGLVFTKPTIVRSAGPAKKLVDACRTSHEITIEAWLQPANARQGGPARIVSLSKDPYRRNVTLGQERDGLDVRLRTTTTGENGKKPSLGAPDTLATKLTHVVYTRDRTGKARLYVDGAVRAEKAIGGDLGTWDGGYRLALGNELTRDRPWLGTLRLVALYSRALGRDEVGMNYRAGPDTR